jgi:hypothetical protein
MTKRTFWTVRHTITVLNGLVDATISCLAMRDLHSAIEGRYTSLSGEAHNFSVKQKHQQRISEFASRSIDQLQREAQKGLSEIESIESLSMADRRRFAGIISAYGELCTQIVRDGAQHAMSMASEERPSN